MECLLHFSRPVHVYRFLRGNGNRHFKSVVALTLRQPITLKSQRFLATLARSAEALSYNWNITSVEHTGHKINFQTKL